MFIKEENKMCKLVSPNQNYGYMFPPQFNYGFPQFPAYAVLQNMKIFTTANFPFSRGQNCLSLIKK
jgi:hypothetical protein